MFSFFGLIGKNAVGRTKTYQLDKSWVFYISDETRDLEAAKKSEISSVAVTWGYNSEKALLRCEPNYLARKPEDILTLLSHRH